MSYYAPHPVTNPLVAAGECGGWHAHRALRRGWLKASKARGGAPGAIRAALLSCAAPRPRYALTEVAAGVRTGDWSIIRHPSRPGAKAHRIRLGSLYPETINRKPPRAKTHGRASVAAYGDAIIEHEAWHARITDMDTEGLSEELRAIRAPWWLLNVFEDVRIEAHARAAGVSWGWLRWVGAVDGKVAHPASALLAQKIEEGGRTHFAIVAPLTRADADRVATYYFPRIAAAPTTRALIPIIVEWMDEFSHYPHDNLPGDIPEGVVHVPHDPADGPADDDTMAGSPIVTDTRIAPGRTRPSPAKDRPRPLPAHYADPDRNDSTEADARRLADRLARLATRADASTMCASASGSRLHVPGIARRDPSSSFRSLRPGKGAPRVAAIFDHSGSMFRAWRRGGRAFAYALLDLDRRGVIRLDLLATTWGGSAGFFTHRFSRGTTWADLVATDATAGAEGIAHALERWRAEVLAADVAILYTDGDITDTGVRADAWRREGADLVGACTSDPSALGHIRRNMLHHFGRAITASTDAELATALLDYMLRRSR